MKNQIIKNLLTLLFVSLLFTNCNSTTKTKETKGATSSGKVASVEVEVFDALKLKDQIVEAIEATPKTEEIADFINKAGASHILDLTVATSDFDKFITDTQMSMAMGLYGFDLIYAKTYQRADMVSQLSDLEQELIKKLGIEDGHNSYKVYGERIKANMENTDSLDYLVTKMMNESYQKFMVCDHTYIYALSFIASNIEGLYILGQLTMLAQNNDPMLQFMAQQKDRVKSIHSLLAITAEDENVKPLYDMYIPVVEYFEKKQSLNNDDIESIVEVLGQIRNEIMK